MDNAQIVYFGSFRRENVWPELDNLLRDEDDTTVSTTYTAAIPEYRVVFPDKSDSLISEANGHANGYANGNTVYDAQHPCRYQWRFTSFSFSKSPLLHWTTTTQLQEIMINEKFMKITFSA